MSIYSSFRAYSEVQFHYFMISQRRMLDKIIYEYIIRKKLKKYPQFKEIKKDKKYLKECRTFISESFSGYKNTNWHHYYSTLNGNKSIAYIPNLIFFSRIEPTLNKFKLSPAYIDKVSLDNFFKKSEVPKTIFKIFNGRFYDEENKFCERIQALNFLTSLEEDVVLKPAILSGGGRNIVIDKAKIVSKLFEEKPHLSTGSYIIQQKVSQHAEMAKFNPPSLNTCRIMTARIENKIVILSAYFRMGRNNNTVDNAQSGGLFCQIGQDGQLSEFAIDKKTNQFIEHPDTGHKFSGFSIPNYKLAKGFCLKNHMRFLRFTFISWDIGIQADGSPVFIELNIKNQAIHGHQVLNGPLFGEHTQYFIDRYNEENKKDSYYI